MKELQHAFLSGKGSVQEIKKKNISYLFYVEFLKGLSGAVDGVLLHLLGHVGVLDDCLAVRHSGVGSVTIEHIGAV